MEGVEAIARELPLQTLGEVKNAVNIYVPKKSTTQVATYMAQQKLPSFCLIVASSLRRG